MCPKRAPGEAQKGLPEAQNEHPEAPGAKVITKVHPGTTVQHFWPQEAQQCCTVALFREKTFEPIGLAACLTSFSQPNQVI